MSPQKVEVKYNMVAQRLKDTERNLMITLDVVDLNTDADYFVETEQSSSLYSSHSFRSCSVTKQSPLLLLRLPMVSWETLGSPSRANNLSHCISGLFVAEGPSEKEGAFSGSYDLTIFIYGPVTLK
jgi:hypothetical protein